jgi:hypothetical protein
MSLESYFFGYIMLGIFITCILYVAFGQITVRKLRKNPVTRDALGAELASGWDIINVAQALAFPRYLSKKIAESPISFMHANADILLENTSRFDRILGALFYWLFMISSLSMALLALLDTCGVFDK